MTDKDFGTALELHTTLRTWLEHRPGDPIRRLSLQGRQNPHRVRVQVTRSPLTSPPPPVVFPRSTFCFTGRFQIRSRREHEERIGRLGGKVRRGVESGLDYLVIGDGSLGSAEAVADILQHRKVNEALSFRIAVVSESHLEGSDEDSSRYHQMTGTSEGGQAARDGEFARPYLVDAKFAELVGMCRGVIADRTVVTSEARALQAWLDGNRGRLPEWPTVLLADRLHALLLDGHVDEEEREDLLLFLDEFVAGNASMGLSTTLPLDDPEPFISYEGSGFCVTGTFIFGSRSQVEAKIQEEGGRVSARPGAADYVVIGTMVSPAWKFGTHGLKIEEAVAGRAQKGSPKIVSEAHWVTSLT